VDARGIVGLLRSEANADNVAGMARFGINTERALGIGVTRLRSIARDVRRSVSDRHALHMLAADLWHSGIHEAMMLAAILDPPELATRRQLDAWVRDLDSWDTCDGFAFSLVAATPFAHEKAARWATRQPEFVRRAGFATMAALAVHDKAADDDAFRAYFPLIERYSTDERNFVRKAVNWALRQIGKRNATLQRDAIALACEIDRIDSRAARWVARDALRELVRYAPKRPVKSTSSRTARRPART
jgi:3-methyladenine DNA glycosylase AlkD